MDPKACNYNPDANYNVQNLCCYPGLCYDRDLSLACPSEGELVLRLDIFPNPAESQITLQSTNEIVNEETKYMVYNYYGKVVLEKSLGILNGNYVDQLDISNYESGIYLVRLYSGRSTDSRMFNKK